MKPRIVILSAFLEPFRSGAEACAEHVPRSLVDRYSFTIVTARLTRSLPKREILPEGIPVIRVGLGLPTDKWLFPFLSPFAARRLKPQIVHAILETFAGLALLFCRWIVPGSKYLLTLQTTNRRFLKKAIIRGADVLTAISRTLVEIARKSGRFDAHRIPNGIALMEITRARLQYQKIPRRILFVGRLEPQKGVDTLLSAFASIADKCPSAHLHIVGDGSQKSFLVSRCSSLVKRGRVTFTGHIPPPNLWREFAQAEIFCGLSRSEALGNVFLEAQASGCAVIGTRVHGIPDIITHGENGLLVEPDRPAEAASSLFLLLRDPALRKNLAQAGIRHAERFDWSSIAMEYARIYDTLIDDRTRPTALSGRAMTERRERTSWAAWKSDSKVPASTHSSARTEAVSSP